VTVWQAQKGRKAALYIRQQENVKTDKHKINDEKRQVRNKKVNKIDMQFGSKDGLYCQFSV